MIKERKIIKFDYCYYCVLKIQDDWNGHDTVHIRKVNRVRNGYFTVKTPEGVIEVTADVQRMEAEQCDIDKWRNWYKETKFGG